MYKLSLIFLRNKKATIIYVLLFTLINVIISLFCMAYLYNNYLINIYSNYRENREFILITSSESIAQIQKEFEIESAENIIAPFYEDSYYLILLKNYEDIESFNKYLKNNNIKGHLANSEKQIELEVIKNQSKTFHYIFKLILIISLIIFFFLIKSIIVNARKYLFLLKALGYNVFQVNYILFTKIFLIILFSIILSFVTIYLLRFSYLIILDKNLKIFLKTINFFRIAQLYIVLILLSSIVSIFVNLFKYKKTIL